MNKLKFLVKLLKPIVELTKLATELIKLFFQVFLSYPPQVWGGFLLSNLEYFVILHRKMWKTFLLIQQTFCCKRFTEILDKINQPTDDFVILFLKKNITILHFYTTAVARIPSCGFSQFELQSHYYFLILRLNPKCLIKFVIKKLFRCKNTFFYSLFCWGFLLTLSKKLIAIPLIQTTVTRLLKCFQNRENTVLQPIL